MSGDSILTGSATDSEGRYSFESGTELHEGHSLRISSIGFEAVLLEASSEFGTVVLNPRGYSLEAVKVVQNRVRATSGVAAGKEKIDQRTASSAVPSNITSAVKAPSVTRSGSAHSSKIRVHGTSPDYYVNGISVGRDPNHFGAFSIIPASMVDRIGLQPKGTDARYSQPSVITLSTPTRFQKHRQGDLSLSLIDATGSYSVGNDRVFAAASVRKSVLDKLVQYFDLHSNRRTLPPTNFQDVYFSAGWKMTDEIRLLTDQYHVRDYLTFVSGGTDANPDGMKLAQHARESMYGLRLEYLGNNSLHQIAVATRSGEESYLASPQSSGLGAGSRRFALDLFEDRSQLLFSWNSKIGTRLGDIAFGTELDRVVDRNYKLKQTDWNFQPPDAGSDLPYIYQNELNEQYHRVNGNQSYSDLAGYWSLNRESEKRRTMLGLRIEKFGALESAPALSLRSRVDFALSADSWLELAAGTYAASPVDRVLEPYQVLVREDLGQLRPVATKLFSAHYRSSGVNFGMFAKSLSSMPVLNPDLGSHDESDPSEGVSLAMRSEGSASFLGGDVTYESGRILGSSVSLYTFYSYVHAVRTTDGITVPYELSAPHQFFAETRYRAGKGVTLGADFSLRSGHAYTSTASLAGLDPSERKTEEYYNTALARQSQERFPLSLSLDLHASFEFGNSQLSLNIANATDHGNAVVNSSDGFIYDAGVLPSIGYRVRF